MSSSTKTAVTVEDGHPVGLSERDGDLQEQPIASPKPHLVQALVRDLNRVYRDRPALWENDFEASGFYWLEPNDAENSVVAFARTSRDFSDIVATVLNLTPVPRYAYRVGLPREGRWVEAVNTDSTHYGGSDVGNCGGVVAEPVPWGGQPFSAEVTLPPLAGLWLVPEAAA